jgi:hypothetical protein
VERADVDKRVIPINSEYITALARDLLTESTRAGSRIANDVAFSVAEDFWRRAVALRAQERQEAESE